MTTPELLSIPGFADPVSSLTHLLGAAVALVAGWPLIRRGMKAKDVPGTDRHALRVASLIIFVFSAVFLLSMSGVYHLLRHDMPARALMQRLDHAAIFVLIAGTATPIHAIMLKGRWRWGMLALFWIVAIAGVTLKSIYFASFPQNLGVLMYLSMGWMGAVSMVLLGRRYGLAFILPLVLGGMVYTAGALLEIFQPRPLLRAVLRSHELFHLAVLGGLTWHWRFIWMITMMEGSADSTPRGEISVRPATPPATQSTATPATPPTTTPAATTAMPPPPRN